MLSTDAHTDDLAAGPIILFVDDDEPNLKVLTVHLGAEFRLLTAQNGPRALALVEQHADQVGLVVADQRMAGMSGTELLTLVKERYPGIGRMLITAYADLEPIVTAINDGQISGYIRKPWNPTDIRMILRSGLERYILRKNLDRANVELLKAEQDRLVAFLAAGVGHEINNPAAVLRINLHLMAQTLEQMRATATCPSTAEQLVELLEMTQDANAATNILSNISADLRNLGARRNLTEPASATDVNQAVTRALRFLGARVASEAHIEPLLQPVPAVLADTGGLTQVVINLVANAGQALEASGVSEGGHIRIRTWSEDDRVMLEVTDNGEGIPQSDLARVFEPFFTTKGNKGMGIGLPVCKRIIESWGGSIVVHSETGVGTTMTVGLQAAPEEQKSHSEGCPKAAEARPKYRVLVVDDDRAVLKALQRGLRSSFGVDGASSGDQALELLQQHHYDALLCDLQMPGLDGAAVHEYVRLHRPRLLGRTVIITGGAVTSRGRAFLENSVKGGTVVVEKPFDIGALTRLLRRMVEEDAAAC